jgi:NADPH-dependent curcumin reductase CurA
VTRPLTSTRAVVLRRRPEGRGPVADDFALAEIELPALGAGDLLVRNAYMSVDPSMRGRLEETEKHYTTNFQIDHPLDGSALGTVVASEDPAVAVGAVVRHRMGWRDHAVIAGSSATVIDASQAPLPTWLGLLGQTGFTAYVGLVRTAEFRAGDAVFVSAAAGAVGSAAGQFARLMGASRVVGSAGGRTKAQLLVDELGFSAGFDYRGERPNAALARLAPDGIDVYFDNVGGEQLVAALDAMRIGGRVALCGMISNFDTTTAQPGINHLIVAVLKRITIRGFIVRDHEDLRAQFESDVSGWLRSGAVVSRDTIVEGLDHAVDAFLGMLAGVNVGKMLVKIDPEAPGGH